MLRHPGGEASLLTVPAGGGQVLSLVMVVSRRMQGASKAQLVERVRVPAVAIVRCRVAMAKFATGAQPDELVGPVRSVSFEKWMGANQKDD